MTLLSTSPETANMPPKAVFKVRPEMTKHEVKEYLQKIYNVEVVKVNTMNMPEMRRVVPSGPTGRKVTREPRWKKAIVRLRRKEGNDDDDDDGDDDGEVGKE